MTCSNGHWLGSRKDELSRHMGQASCVIIEEQIWKWQYSLAKRWTVLEKKVREYSLVPGEHHGQSIAWSM